MHGIRTLVDSQETFAGLAAGLVALVVAVAGIRWWVPRCRGADRSVPPGVVGPAVVGATLVAIAGVGPLPAAGSLPRGVVLGVLALWIAGELAARARAPWRTGLGTLLALPGGSLLASTISGPGWVIALLVVGPAAAGAAAAECDERGARIGAGPLLALVALLGMYATVPDTEMVRAALGAAVPLGLLAWPRARARLGRGGSHAFVGLFLWLAVLEGVGRPGSVVGAAACLGLLVLEPVSTALRARGPLGPGPAGPLGLLVVSQVVVVAYSARVAGFAEHAGAAALLVTPVALGAVWVLRAVTDRSRRAGPTEPRGPAPPG